MKSTGDILKELGFKKDASRETQEAFLKHLLMAAGIKVLKPHQKAVTNDHKVGEQLAFNFVEQSSNDKKVS